MGYYIPNDIDVSKRPNTIRVPQPESLSEISKDQALICAISNPFFDAYGFVYSEQEFKEFTYSKDNRPKRWYTMPLDQAIELTGFNPELHSVSH